MPISQKITRASLIAIIGLTSLHAAANTAVIAQENPSYGSINRQTEDLLPNVNAGRSINLVLPETKVSLQGSIQDETDLAPWQWIQISGPAKATITAPTSLTPEVTLPEQSGEYIFRLLARDAVNTSYDDLSIYLHDSENLPETPIVHAGSARATWLPETKIQLNGTYFNGTATSIQWKQVLGPGASRFSSPDALSTEVEFDSEGVYVLELTIDAEGKIGSDRLVVEVYPDYVHFGYDTEQLKQLSSRDLNQEYNYVGLDFDRIKSPPAPGIHPRILVNPEDREDILARVQNTPAGQKTMHKITDTLWNQLTGGGIGEIPQYEGGGPQYAEIYDRLGQGDADAFAHVDVSTLVNSKHERGTNDRDRIVALLTYEGFRCWLEQDQAGGEKAAAALAAIASVLKKDIEAALPTNHYRIDIQEKIHRQFIGYAYDFIHPFMDEAQREIVRETLVLATKEMWCIGMDAVPIVGASTSNWVSSSALHLLMNTLAIEGETGADPYMYPRLLAAYERFYTLGLYESGMTYEGLGKNTLCAESALALSKRGDHLIALRGVKNHIRQHYNYSMVPWGNAFTWDESLGYVEGQGRYVDAPVLKYAYPNDPLIDFAYRNDFGGEQLPRLNDFNIRFPYKSMDFLVRALTAEPWDESKNWKAALKDLEALPLTAFCNDRGRFITRNDWSAESLQLHFQPRSVRGGHCFEDRNHIIINALGRNWLTRNAYHKVDHENHSILTIDGEGPSVRPAAVVQQYDLGAYALSVGEATDAYNWKTDRSGASAKWTLNDYRALPSDDFMFELPREDHAHWQSAQKSNDGQQRFNQVEYVYRTAALIRGAHPYILLVDDAKKDDRPHVYGSRLQLPKDITAQIDGLTVTLIPESGNERMQIQAFDAAGQAQFELEQNPGSNGATALVLKTEAMTSNFKMIFFPYMEGETLPNIRKKSKGKWSINIESQTHDLSFNQTSSGLSATSIKAK